MEPSPRIGRIEEAAQMVDPHFLATPLVRNETPDRELGCRLALKLETLTPIRSFKGGGSLSL